MEIRKLTFPGGQGELLAGRLDLPEDGVPRAYALFAHCFTCTKNLRATVEIDRVLTAAGLGVLRFDFTGLGESDGDFAATNFSSNVADLVAAAEFLAERFQAPRLLIGHSLGGAAVLQAAARILDCHAVATIAAPSHPIHLEGHLPDRDLVERDGSAEVEIAGRRIRITRQFLADLEATRMERTIADLDRALLILHSPRDRIVGIDHAGRIFAAARHPKSYLSLDRADHLLSDPADAAWAGRMIAAWAAPYLEPTVDGAD